VPRRLGEIYRVADRVEILFSDESGEEWRPAEIVAFQHPGLWARTLDGQIWFVTNGRHIRRPGENPLVA
jgi:hypothetical protein